MFGTAVGEAGPAAGSSARPSDWSDSSERAPCGSNPIGSLGTADGPPADGAGGVKGAPGAGAGGVNGAPGAGGGAGGVKGAPGAGAGPGTYEEDGPLEGAGGYA
ncbi:hypothetical protein GCM10010423_20570 [Streptomyces levis]|uniref:Uncharacterized protein n=1 Tax=Streptomyces levis TaxID=285566 RepID=A0ABN3NM42_9ACTN